MLQTRILTAALLVPVVLVCICVGTVPFLLLTAVTLTLAEIEFCRLVARDGFNPAPTFGVGLVWLFLLDAQAQTQFQALTLNLLEPGFVVIVLSSLVWHIKRHQRDSSPIADWALTLTGGIYLGVGGLCLIRLRGMEPDGLWWTLTAIPAVMFADTSAYFYGKARGKHGLAPTLSPDKTWEGYWAGVIAGGAFTATLVTIWQALTNSTMEVTVVHGLILGTLIATISPLGDLAVSMIKRRADVKDSSHLFPGHGGALDRVDTVLWAAIIGYFYALIVTA